MAGVPRLRYLSHVAQALEGNDVHWGAQDCSPHEKGAAYRRCLLFHARRLQLPLRHRWSFGAPHHCIASRASSWPSRLGLAIAHTAAKHGAAVVVSGLEQADCDRVAGEIKGLGRDAIGLACDVSDRSQISRLVEATLGHFGRVDTLVCNAGVQGPAGPIGDPIDSDWTHVMDVNLRSAMWLTTAVIPGMAERRGGSVFLMSSIVGLRGNKGDRALRHVQSRPRPVGPEPRGGVGS